MAQVISDIFERIQAGVLGPLDDGIMGLLPALVRVAILISIVSLVFGFSSIQRNAKIAIIVGLVAVAFLVPYVPTLIADAMGMGGGPADPAAVEGGAQQAPAALSDLSSR